MSLPPNLARLVSTAGAHRRGHKILAFGPTGSGKSFLLASMPPPLAVIDVGEGGIQPYLRPPKMGSDGRPAVDVERVFAGEEDICFSCQSPDDVDEAVEWILKNEARLKSTALEPMNSMWEDHMDTWNEKLGHDITAGEWRLVKGPWKSRLKHLMRSPLNVGFGAWMKDTAYEQVETKSMPGVDAKPKLVIKSQEVPQVEKSVPYTVDMVLQTEVVLDKKNRPTPKHRVTLTKGRRPRSIPASEFYVGRKWDFDAKSPVNPWDVIIGPLVDKWQDGAVDYLGLDPQEAQRELKEISIAAGAQEMGRILQVIAKPFKNLMEYKTVFDSEIAQTLNLLNTEQRAIVQKAHEQLKKQLAG